MDSYRSRKFHIFNQNLNKLVFTIKQSYLLLKEICDFHILNFTNFEPYQWLDETIVAWEVFEQYHPQMILENGFNVDVMFPVIRNYSLSISLFKK